MIAATIQIDFNGSCFIDSQNRPVESARMLADAAVEAVRSGVLVTMDFRALPSVSSSYFNMLLSRIADECGTMPFSQNRIVFRFSSGAQKVIFDRSYLAVIGGRLQ